jgi:hypothetical protein
MDASLDLTLHNPFAYREGTQEWITPEMALESRSREVEEQYVCPVEGCGSRLILKQRNRAFFSHVGDGSCAAGESVPHQFAKMVMAEIAGSFGSGDAKIWVNLDLDCKTPECEGVAERLPLTKFWGGLMVDVEVERSLREQGSLTRPDVSLTVQRSSETVSAAIEICHRNPLTPEKRHEYDRLKVPYLELEAEDVIAGFKNAINASPPEPGRYRYMRLRPISYGPADFRCKACEAELERKRRDADANDDAARPDGMDSHAAQLAVAGIPYQRTAEGREALALAAEGKQPFLPYPWRSEVGECKRCRKPRLIYRWLAESKRADPPAKVKQCPHCGSTRGWRGNARSKTYKKIS